jgi:hypothetical protein
MSQDRAGRADTSVFDPTSGMNRALGHCLPLLTRQEHGRDHSISRRAQPRREWSLASHLHFFILMSSAPEFGNALGAAAGPFAAAPSTSNNTVT